MRVIWAQHEPISVGDLTEKLSGNRPLAYTTVMTVTERLRNKGWLERVKVSRSYRYSAARTEQDYTADLMDLVLDGSADRTTALLHFAGRLDPAEAAALRAALDRAAGE